MTQIFLPEVINVVWNKKTLKVQEKPHTFVHRRKQNGPYTTACAIQDWVGETPMVPVKPYNKISILLQEYKISKLYRVVWLVGDFITV